MDVIDTTLRVGSREKLHPKHGYDEEVLYVHLTVIKGIQDIKSTHSFKLALIIHGCNFEIPLNLINIEIKGPNNCTKHMESKSLFYIKVLTYKNLYNTHLFNQN